MIKEIRKNHENCKKCGVKLVDKNIKLSTYDKDTGLYFVRSECAHCNRKASFCTLVYENLELEALSKKMSKKLWNQKYYLKNVKPKKYFLRKILSPPKECIVCGIELCDKNRGHQKASKIYPKCKTCAYGYKTCKVIYSNSELDKLSKIQYKYLSKKLWKLQNPERDVELFMKCYTKNRKKYNEHYKAYSAKQRTELSDVYIKRLIVHNVKDKRWVPRKPFVSLDISEVTPHLIEIKRKQVELYRTLKQMI
jgi:hypothetical protein